MKKIFNENRFFLYPLFLFWICISLALFFIPKPDLHLLLNTYHSSSLDQFFVYFTEVGGWFPFLVVFLLLFYKYGAGLMVLMPQLLVALPIYITKQFYDSPRPISYFAGLQMNFPQIVGVDYHCTNSFPSGHTTAAFALFFVLSVMVNRSAYKLLFFFLALLIGYSRIYLSQHFAADVLGGSVIGVLFSYAYMCYHQRFQKSWMDSSLLKLFRLK